MAEGLENLLTVTGDHAGYGMSGGYMQGQIANAGLQQTLAGTANMQANTDRTVQSTPSYVANSQNQAEANRLANIPGQLDQQNGTDQVSAQTRLAQAKQVYKQIPQKMIEEAHANMAKAIQENFLTMANTVQQTGDMKKALALGRQHLQDAGANLPPDELQKQLSDFDQAGQQAIQQFGSSPEGMTQWAGKLKDFSYSAARSAGLSDPNQQNKMVSQDQQATSDLERTKVIVGGRENVAQTNATAKAAGTSGNKRSTAEIIAESIRRAGDRSLSPEERQFAADTANVLGHVGDSTTHNSVGGQEIGSNRKESSNRIVPVGSSTPKLTDKQVGYQSYLKHRSAAKSDAERSALDAEARKQGLLAK